MARGLNHCCFIGNVGAKPELRYTQSGTAVCNFNIAVSERWTRDGEQHERTEWIKCVAWRQLAETAGEYLDKGKQVYVDGRMLSRKYQDRDGAERTAVELHVRNFIMLGRKGDSADPNVDPPHPDPGSQDPDDQIPF